MIWTLRDCRTLLIQVAAPASPAVDLDELKAHLRGALNNGLTREEISEIFLQVAIYGGMPAAVDAFREMMFERVYLAEDTLADARRGQAIVRALFHHYQTHPESIPGWSLPEDPAWRRAADYVSGMTGAVKE